MHDELSKELVRFRICVRRELWVAADQVQTFTMFSARLFQRVETVLLLFIRTVSLSLASDGNFSAIGCVSDRMVGE